MVECGSGAGLQCVLPQDQGRRPIHTTTATSTNSRFHLTFIAIIFPLVFIAILVPNLSLQPRKLRTPLAIRWINWTCCCRHPSHRPSPRCSSNLADRTILLCTSSSPSCKVSAGNSLHTCPRNHIPFISITTSITMAIFANEIYSVSPPLLNIVTSPSLLQTYVCTLRKGFDCNLEKNFFPIFLASIAHGSVPLSWRSTLVSLSFILPWMCTIVATPLIHRQVARTRTKPDSLSHTHSHSLARSHTRVRTLSLTHSLTTYAHTRVPATTHTCNKLCA